MTKIVIDDFKRVINVGTKLKSRINVLERNFISEGEQSSQGESITQIITPPAKKNKCFPSERKSWIFRLERTIEYYTKLKKRCRKKDWPKKGKVMVEEKSK